MHQAPHLGSILIWLTIYILSETKPSPTKLTKCLFISFWQGNPSAITFSSAGFEGITKESHFYRVKRGKAEIVSDWQAFYIGVIFGSWAGGDFPIAVQSLVDCEGGESS